MRFALLLTALPLCGHMMSMSSGDAVLKGTHLQYTLAVPLFEIAHTSNPERALLEHIRFGGARMISHECHAEPARDSYICHAEYEFSSAPDQLEVRCTFPEVTVPNHVHLLRATHGAKQDRAVFDSAFTTATLRFRPPTPAEVAVQQIAGAAAHVVTGLLPVLFLATLALTATSWPDLAAIIALFLAGQLAGALIPWQPAPKFLEAAAAIAVAYLAFEVIFLPPSKIRWVFATCLGVIPGLILADYLTKSESDLGYAFLGTAIVDIALLVGTAALLFLTLKTFPGFRRIPAALSLVLSLGWFVLTVSR